MPFLAHEKVVVVSCRAAKTVACIVTTLTVQTSLSPRRAIHCRPQKRMASETHSSSSCHLIGCSLWVFNRIKEGFGGDHCVVIVLHCLCFCLFLEAYASL